MSSNWRIPNVVVRDNNAKPASEPYFWYCMYDHALLPSRQSVQQEHVIFAGRPERRRLMICLILPYFANTSTSHHTYASPM